jgi:hypothetical protein
VCERFGVDPGAALGDDFMAHQFRVALAVAHPYKPPDPAADDPFAAAREQGAKVKAMT